MPGKTYMDLILAQENDLLDKILAEQKKFRAAVREKKWDILMDTISAINVLADNFNKVEGEREKLSQISSAFAKSSAPMLAQVRAKLLKSKAENSAIGDYVAITGAFIQGVMDSALPQSGSRVYSRDGSIVHSQPSSVVVNKIF